MEGVEVVTFGCRLNIFESEVMRTHAQRAGLEKVIIVHTCAVTAEAERQARQAIRRARRENPEARIVVTGCSVQVASGGYAAMQEVDAVVGNAEKMRPETWAALAASGERQELVGDIMSVTETAGHLVSGFDGRTRAFLQVQNGCDHRCTFCIIPYGRGNSRSVRVADVVAQARTLVENGYRELVVTGVDITSYGKELPGQPSLGAMLAAVLDEVPELPRLRLSSIDPAELDPELERLIAEEPRLMPHLHLSVQAGDDMILKRMKRRHLRGDVIELAARLRRLRPDVVLGADLIAGFPTESAEMFENSLRLVGEAGLTFLHVFPYSPRPGTPAARMPQVAKDVRKERAGRLRAAGEAALDAFLAGQLGQRRRALIERSGTGHTDHFAPLRVLGEVPPAGTIALFEIAGMGEGMLEGRMAA
ncbi:tRNA (N(6)-L-threonylcarbamoyladenosine(37)-C(2))-methylthiotransferase MtaB [Marinimicrococcus flavescens]|uniref:tRNA (N(6)-L-threonylcarbamoyladenosine(37)-C(2))-methylthiotransferase MtaB n=1 Tax=Marinimicrococcus flavescens TaxID=3031815 RepID=A0AAP3XSG5_9PROT|nr:tRNA (N(6)-L-threonylcarbamoyladenosine(37)-C(2))-methylthiotransferase MtaB [Marinimicrococcus flavescens]